MRALGVLFITALLGVLAQPAQAQLEECDDCDYYFGGGGNNFAHCVFGGGGPLLNCYQEFQHFCSAESTCMPDEEEAPELALAGGVAGARSTIGDVAFVERRICDNSAVIKVYAAEGARNSRRALRRIVI